MKNYSNLETNRLLIRPTQIGDADFILKLVNSPKWIELIGDREVHSIEEAENYITSKMLPQLEKLGFTNNTIIRKNDNVKIGICGLFKRDETENIEIGFALLPEFENQGYAFEANIEMISFAKNKLNVKSVTAFTNPENLASQKLLEKLGLRFVKSLILPDEADEIFFYKLDL